MPEEYTDVAAKAPALNWSDLDKRAVDTVRVLAMDAVEKAGNGHPGTAMSLAPAAYLLFNRVMRHDPTDPDWTGRDRFVLSCGHSSLTLYIQLYLSGYGLTLDDLASLRQWDSLTPGHPEHGHTPGVEVTTGPLGQGVGNAVGMAMAARRERGLFDPAADPGTSPFDHNIWSICSDGDIEEGVSHEASAIAAVQKLGNLTLIYDDNEISIEDDTRIAKNEDVGARYAAYGWHVQTVDWRTGDPAEGDYHENVEALYDALMAAKAETDRPSFIVLKTIIGWPAPNKQNTGKIHGSALGAEEVAATKELLGFDPNETFAVDEKVFEHARQVQARGREAHAEWQKAFDAWAAANDDARKLHSRMAKRALPDDWESALPEFPADLKGLATRAASGKVLEALAPVLPELWGGSADLAESNNTTMKGEPSFIPSEYATKAFPGNEYGRTLHFGIREHGMGAIMNGIALHGGTRVYGGTFLVFSDYMRGAVRLSALMKLPVIFVWTHDSIGLGEDGPTHQPIEHLSALRAIHGLDVVRPADANETAWAWRGALEHTDRPTAMALSRQNLPTLDRSRYASAEGTLKGGYILSEASGGDPHVILIGTGSEVQHCLEAQERLEAQGTPTRVVSMPCQEWFFEQDTAYQQTVLPRGVKARVSVEAGVRMSWDRILGEAGEAVSIEHYGASAPAKILFEQFGFTADNVVAKANAALAKVGEITGHTTGS
jgi:transketolase